MSSKRSQPLANRSANGAPRQGGDLTHREVRIEGQLNAFWSAVAAIVFLLMLGVIFVLGLVTITIVLWLACGAILLALVVAFVRAIAGTFGRRFPPDSHS